ncbi:unnamed protein product [Blepharisma stoltei]|uniref:Uncharacterized protein n=1 Tax=Blepharisma stoltei TaxID=1481888 RepID=A0AAU9JJC4_9CILI|nr:unnamed protein product [Blepharisma stoltei]
MKREIKDCGPETFNEKNFEDLRINSELNIELTKDIYLFDLLALEYKIEINKTLAEKFIKNIISQNFCTVETLEDLEENKSKSEKGLLLLDDLRILIKLYEENRVIFIYTENENFETNDDINDFIETNRAETYKLIGNYPKSYQTLSFFRLSIKSDFQNLAFLQKIANNDSCIYSLISDINKFVYSHSKKSSKEILILLQEGKNLIDNCCWIESKNDNFQKQNSVSAPEFAKRFENFKRQRSTSVHKPAEKLENCENYTAKAKQEPTIEIFEEISPISYIKDMNNKNPKEKEKQDAKEFMEEDGGEIIKLTEELKSCSESISMTLSFEYSKSDLMDQTPSNNASCLQPINETQSTNPNTLSSSRIQNNLWFSKESFSSFEELRSFQEVSNNKEHRRTSTLDTQETRKSEPYFYTNEVDEELSDKRSVAAQRYILNSAIENMFSTFTSEERYTPRAETFSPIPTILKLETETVYCKCFSCSIF